MEWTMLLFSAGIVVASFIHYIQNRMMIDTAFEVIDTVLDEYQSDIIKTTSELILKEVCEHMDVSEIEDSVVTQIMQNYSREIVDHLKECYELKGVVRDGREAEEIEETRNEDN